MPIGFECDLRTGGCGATRPDKWYGTCPGCGGWYKYRQVFVAGDDREQDSSMVSSLDGQVISFRDAGKYAVEIPRTSTGIAGIDHVLGGGFRSNSASVLSGDRGSGKTTLLMQVCKSLAERQREPVMYVSSEQPINDIVINLPEKMRNMPNNMIGMHESDLNRIIGSIREYQPSLVVIDSAQTTSLGDEYEVGSAMTIKTVIRTLVPLAKRENFAFVLIAHITKDGSVAGPRTLEYLVDSCFWISTRGQKRLFKSIKNRGVECPRSATFEMIDGEGLIEVEETKEEIDNEQPPREGEGLGTSRGARLRGYRS